jgi:succinate-semialdehyde dehydrogenase/glutarate-semialdehyde dehydrogenase
MNKLDTFNPSTGERLAELNITPSQEIQAMLAKSKKAQITWAMKSVRERADLLIKAYEKIEDRAQKLADLIHQEMGKIPTEARGEVDSYIASISRIADEVVEALKPEETTDGVTRTISYWDPLGVCACITPWNFPMGMPQTLMMPSLIAGNTVLFKPSEEVPLVGIEYAKILNKTLPADVLQVVVGKGEQGRELVESDVQLITFTGSQATGKHILEHAVKDLKRVLLELGGKDPLIILEDADLDAAAKFAASNSFRNTGQVCVSTEKIFVMEGQIDEFVQNLKKYTDEFQVGTMINSRQKEHVLQQIDDAVSKGAKIIFGSPKETEGNQIKPVILVDVTPDMNIMVDETFGPVACIATVKNEDEAVEQSNSGSYALGGVVFGNNLDHARSVARRLDAGMVGINRRVGGASGSPWVGAKGSGYGYHGSSGGHRQFTQLRIVSEPL